MPHWKDLTGYRSGWLEALYRIEDSGGAGKHTKWMCLCHRCGNIIPVESGHLTSKWRPQLSCCLKGSYESSTYKDLTGKTFYMLHVNSIAERGAKGKHIKWNCTCICGRHTVVDAGDLLSNKVTSCGCRRMSQGERAIMNVLNVFNINYDIQYQLNDCKTSLNGTPRMDFVLYDSNNSLLAFIEYQGLQHYVDLGYLGKREREETDELKKDYCSKRNIPLLEILYNDNPTQATMKILESFMLIPCQASQEEGVTTI